MTSRHRAVAGWSGVTPCSRLVFGLIAWGLSALGFVLILASAAEGIQMGLMFLGVLLFFGSGLPAVLGVGLGASALRARGNHLIIATIGLFLSGLHVGVVIGLFGFSVWQM